MEDILKEVQTYDSDTLRKKLADYGVKVGPIAKTTISLFQRRLAKELFRLQGGSTEEIENTSQNEKSTPPVSNSSDSSVNPLSKTNQDTPTKFADLFYAVCLPENAETTNGNSADDLVFSDKALALKTAKLYKGSRFKVFKSEEDAKIYSKLSAETAFQSPRRPSKEETPTKESSQVAVESSPFKAPKPQDVSKLKKVIEQGDLESFKKHVWENPRYLVSGGDTPTIYQEGARYTALHVATIKNQPDICKAILDILEDPQFVNTLYGQGKINEEMQNSRINFLVDMYLNMPDKGCCESPLHMACKYGYERVVEILAAHPRTDKELKNKWGCSPKDLICERSNAPAPAMKKKIEELLKGQCYVPLIRSDDNIAPPVIGQPWSPDVNKSLIDIPHISHSPIESSLTVKACAGPMSPSDAGIFHKRWTTPPTHSPEKKKAYFNTKRSDSEKGMERIGRQLAHELHIPWSEYWEFLDQFVDLSTSTGLDMLEHYLRKRSWLKFVKDFKDRYFIEDQIEDFQGAKTPTTSPTALTYKTESSKSVDSVFGSPSNNNNTNIKDQKVDKDNIDVTKHTEHSLNMSDANISDIVSPVTNLSMKFSRMKLNDSSSEWALLKSLKDSDTVQDNVQTEGDDLEQSKDVSDKQSKAESETIGDKDPTSSETSGDKDPTSSETSGDKDPTSSETSGDKDSTSSETSEDKDPTSSETSGVKDPTSSKTSEDKDPTSSETSGDKDPTSSETSGDKDPTSSKTSGDKDPTSSKTSEDKDPTSSKTSGDKDPTSSETSGDKDPTSSETSGDKDPTSSEASGDKDPTGCVSTDDVLCNDITRKVGLERCKSTGSDSTASYETATEGDDETYTSLPFDSLSSEPASLTVFIKITDKSVIENLKSAECESSVSNNVVKLIVQLKDSLNGEGLVATIISVPVLDNIQQLVLLEDVDVESVDGNISSVVDGDIVKIVTCEENLTIPAYLTRATTLPKCGYIHGPQPTREDLNVSRAIGEALITPDSHPNVFNWKISLGKFVRDTNYRWQSPAKLSCKPKIRQSSPLASPLGQNSPIIPYRSSLSSSSQQSDIRTKLFPSIME